MVYKQLQQEVIEYDLILDELPITNLGNVKRFNEDIYLSNNKTLKSLGNLEYVRRNLWLYNTNIEDLGNLKECDTIYLTEDTKIPVNQYNKFDYQFKN